MVEILEAPRFIEAAEVNLHPDDFSSGLISGVHCYRRKSGALNLIGRNSRELYGVSSGECRTTQTRKTRHSGKTDHFRGLSTEVRHRPPA